MPIFKINDIRIHKVNVSDSGAYYNDIKLKKGDVVHIRCDRCGVSDSFKYRSLKHFSEIRLLRWKNTLYQMPQKTN
jgi:ribosomal protein L37E